MTKGYKIERFYDRSGKLPKLRSVGISDRLYSKWEVEVDAKRNNLWGVHWLPKEKKQETIKFYKKQKVMIL